MNVWMDDAEVGTNLKILEHFNPLCSALSYFTLTLLSAALLCFAVLNWIWKGENVV